MADIIKGLFGGKAATTTAAAGDFADFATAASPTPAGFSTPSFFGGAPTDAAVPYTKWYRVWERTSPADFKAEAVLVPLAALIFLQLMWGRRTNRGKARSWMAAHAPILEKEFASVGFSGIAHGKGDNSQLGPTDPSSLLKEKTATEFVSYGTGRQNVAFVDVKISLYRRFNPLIWLLETVAAMMLAIVKPPKENVEVVVYTFDGQEKTLVPAAPIPAADGDDAAKPARIAPSGYDGFVWAIVHKDLMKDFRSDRYDVSLTDVKDNAKLPAWATVMSESAEITDAFLTPELVKAIETAGYDLFEYLLISDMPADQPTTIDELDPRKRLFLSLKLPSGSSVSSFDRTLPVFSHFLQLPDELVKKGKFRAEVQKKLRRTREDEATRVKKATDDEKAEERKTESDKRKKQEREDLLRTMSPAEQRKYLDKERDKQNRKNMRRVR